MFYYYFKAFHHLLLAVSKFVVKYIYYAIRSTPNFIEKYNVVTVAINIWNTFKKISDLYFWNCTSNK